MLTFRMLVPILITVGSAYCGESIPATTQPVCLLSQEPASGAKSDGGLLIREYARQAVLLAARESLNLPTRDQGLRETFPADGIALQISTEAIRGKGVTITLSHKGGAQIYKKELPLNGATMDYERLAEVCEQLSRTEIPEALNRAGIQTRGVTVPASKTELPAPVETRLAKLSFISQFQALCEIHKTIHAGGESPQLLGGLVRAYANLGELTEPFFSGEHKVFKARAILYAQRWVATDPASPLALAHRAYARTLAGFYGAALTDIKEARTKFEAAKTAPVQLPSWLPLIEACGHYNTAKLLEDSSDLAKLLAFTTVERYQSKPLTLKVAEQVLKADPQSWRVLDYEANLPYLDIQQASTAGVLKLASTVLPAQLLALEGLPQEAKKPLSNAPDLLALAQAARALVDAKEQAEPSWSMLGRMLQELQFAQAYRRAHFMRVVWSVDASQFVASMLPIIADHPYKCAVEAYGNGGSAKLNQLDLVDAQECLWPLIADTLRINTAGKIQGNRAKQLLNFHADDVVPDLDQMVLNADGAEQARLAHVLARISPHSPVAAGKLLIEDWTFAQPHVAEWEQDFSGFPIVMGSLGKAYAAHGKPAEAERCLKTYVKGSGDYFAYEALADFYSKQGKWDLWKSTYDEFLTTETHGLEPAMVQEKIARHFLATKDFKSAKPYALAAAEVGSQWGIECARDYYAGVGDWEKAEQMELLSTQRYNSSPLELMLWYAQTQHGDFTKLAAHYQAMPDATLEHAQMLAGMYMCAHDAAGALKTSKPVFEKTGDPWIGFMAALAADQAKDPATAKTILEGIAIRSPSFLYHGNRRPEMIELASIYHKLLAAGTGGKLDMDAIEACVAKGDEGERASNCYFAGIMLDLHGTAQEAQDFLDRAAMMATPKYNRYLAQIALYQRGVKPGDFKRTPKPQKAPKPPPDF